MRKFNDNCLAGYQCPECRSQGPFNMQTNCWTSWYDDGSEDSDELEVDPEGHATCLECGHTDETTAFDVSKEYVRREGRHCPVCGSIVMEAEPIRVDHNELWRRVKCPCGATWEDRYELVGLLDLRLTEPPKNENENENENKNEE